MKVTKNVIVDADGLIALVNKDDANHQRAITISTILIKENISVLVPITATIEAITASKRALNKPDVAKALVATYINGNIPIIDVTIDILPLASRYFNPHDSKQNTFFDAVIAAYAKKYKAVAIFSFDHWYKRQEFTLISDFFKL